MTTPIPHIPYIWNGTDWVAFGRSVLPPPPPVDTFVLGTTKPWAADTGVPAGTTLAPHYGNMTISTPGTVIDGREVFGWIDVLPSATNVKILNTKVRGPQSTSYSSWVPPGQGQPALIRAQGVSGLTIERCTLRPDYPNYFVQGIDGTGYTALRNDVSGTVDAFFVRGSANILGNYVHDFFFSDQSTDQAGSMPPYWTHNDGIQWRGQAPGTSLVRGNNFQWYPDENVPNGLGRTAVLNTGYAGGPAYYNKSFRSAKSGRLLWGSALTVSPDLGDVTGVTITQNWIEGGTSGFQMNAANPSGASLGELSYNRHGKDLFDFGNGSYYPIRHAVAASIALETTNYWDAVGSVPQALWGSNLSIGFSGGIRIP